MRGDEPGAPGRRRRDEDGRSQAATIDAVKSSAAIATRGASDRTAPRRMRHVVEHRQTRPLAPETQPAARTDPTRYDRPHSTDHAIPAQEPAVPTTPVPDRRLQRRPPRQRPAPDRRRRPPRARRRDQRLVRRRLEARAAGQDGLRAPVRARDVPGLPPRREGGAHRAHPGRRRHDERDDLARSHQLLRDAAVAPARPRPLARGRPDGDAARRAEPGEPRQPARGRQEREALVVRQPAVRLVAGEAAGPSIPARAPVPPLDDRVDGGP